jgi:hypothetical protein
MFKRLKHTVTIHISRSELDTVYIPYDLVRSEWDKWPVRALHWQAISIIPYPNQDDNSSLLSLLLKHVVGMLLSALQTYASIILILSLILECCLLLHSINIQTVVLNTQELTNYYLIIVTWQKLLLLLTKQTKECFPWTSWIPRCYSKYAPTPSRLYRKNLSSIYNSNIWHYLCVKYFPIWRSKSLSLQRII